MTEQMTLDLLPARRAVAALPRSTAGPLDLPVEYVNGVAYYHRRNGWCYRSGDHGRCPGDWFTYRWDRCDCPCHWGGQP